MYTIYLANIRTAQDYEALRRFPTTGLPDSLNLFCQDQHERAADIRSGGNEAVFVDIYVHEFAAYCRNRGDAPNAHTLNNFACEKAIRKS